MGDLTEQIFSSTVKCIGKCGSEWIKYRNFISSLASFLISNLIIRAMW